MGSMFTVGKFPPFFLSKKIRRFFVCYPQRVSWSAILDEMNAQFPSFRPRWPTNKLAGGNKRKNAENSPAISRTWFISDFCGLKRSHKVRPSVFYLFSLLGAVGLSYHSRSTSLSLYSRLHLSGRRLSRYSLKSIMIS